MKMAGIELLEKLRNGQLDDRADRASKALFVIESICTILQILQASRSSCSTIDFLQVFRVFQSSTKCALIPERQPQRKPFFLEENGENWNFQPWQCVCPVYAMFFVRGRGYLHSDLHRGEPRRRMQQPSSCFLSNESDNSWSLLRNHRKTLSDQSLSVTRHVPQLFSTMWYWRESQTVQSQVQIDKVFKLSSWILRILRCKQQKTILKERMRWGSPVAALGFDRNAESWVIRWMCVCTNAIQRQ